MNDKGVFPHVGNQKEQNLIRSLLQKPRALIIEELIDRNFGAIFSGCVIFLLLVSYATSNGDTFLGIEEYSLTRNMPHFAVILLFMGFTLFPKNRHGYAVLGFLLIFTLSTLWSVHSGSIVSPAGINAAGFWAAATLVNLVVGIGLGLLSKKLSYILASRPFNMTLDVALGASLLLVVGIVGTLLSVSLSLSLSWLLELSNPIETALQSSHQIAMGSIGSTLLLIVVLYPPEWRLLLRLLPLIGPFLLFGYLDKIFGWQTEHILTIFFALMLRFVIPVNYAVPITMISMLSLRLFIPDETLNNTEDFLIFSTLLFFTTIIDLILLNKLVLKNQNTRVQNKILGAVKLSKSGYFVYSSKLQRIWTDDVLSNLPEMPFGGTGPEALRRMHPDDAKQVSRAWNSGSERPVVLNIRMTETSPWSEDKPHRVYQLNCISETSWQYGLVSVGSLSDITGLRDTSTALQETLSELEVSKERQHRLFSLISHELRTPAAILKMLAEQMNEHNNWEDLGPRFDAVLAQFLTLMDDLGSAVRDEDLLPANESIFKPNDFLANLAHVYRLMAEDAGLSVDLRTSRKYNRPRISDVGRIQQILGNLVRNSVFHSGGNHLVLSYHERLENGNLEGVWTIEDNGNGIPDALLPGLFEPFNRQTRGVFSASEGTGLGMYIVKLFTENLNGTVVYERSLMGGAKFIVAVPLKTPSVTQNQPTIPVDKYRSKSVILVEDNELVAEITQSMLRKTFGEVYRVTTAEALLDRYREFNPDLVLTDIHLPRMDGGEMATNLRKKGYTGLIIGLSAAAVTPAEFMEKGADNILTKPLSMRALLKIMDDAEDAKTGAENNA